MSDKEDPGGDSTKDEASNETLEKAPPSVPEQVTLAVAALLVVSLAVFLGWYGFQQSTPGAKNSRPVVTARVDAPQAQWQPQGWIVPVEVKNTGNVPLREVMVKASVQDDDGKPGERELTFGFLAEGASETAFVTTFTDPAKKPPTATVQSFQTKPEARGY